MVVGELTTRARLKIPAIVRKTLHDIGYTRSSYGIDSQTCAVMVHLDEQSQDIARGVDGLLLSTIPGHFDRKTMA